MLRIILCNYFSKPAWHFHLHVVKSYFQGCQKVFNISSVDCSHSGNPEGICRGHFAGINRETLFIQKVVQRIKTEPRVIRFEDRGQEAGFLLRFQQKLKTEVS